MAETGFQPKQNGKVIADAVTVAISGGELLHGWKSVRVSKSIDSLAHSFSLGLFDKFPITSTKFPLMPGRVVRINIGDKRVLTGRVDKMSSNLSEGSQDTTVSGRTLTGDLVDCSILGGAEYTNITLEKLAEELLKPFGLKVFTSVETKTLAKFAVKPGERVFEALDRAAKQFAYFWITTRAGNLRLTRAGVARGYSAIQEGVNLKSASLSFNGAKRFNEYIVRGQGSGSDEIPGLQAAQAEGKATDSGIARYRPLLIIAENSVDTGQATTRAEWEASSRVASGMTLNVTLEGWRQGNGEIWGLNQVLRVKIPSMGINRDMLVQSLEQTDGTGKETSMTLVRADSYKPQPTVPADPDDLDALTQAAGDVNAKDDGKT